MLSKRIRPSITSIAINNDMCESDVKKHIIRARTISAFVKTQTAHVPASSLSLSLSYFYNLADIRQRRRQIPACLLTLVT